MNSPIFTNVLLDVASAAAVSAQCNINNVVSTHLTIDFHKNLNRYSKIHNGYDKGYPVEPRE